MKFKDFTAQTMQNRINQLKDGIRCFFMNGSFSSIHSKGKQPKLKSDYKERGKVGVFTEVMVALKSDPGAMRLVSEKLKANGFWGDRYENDEASLKLHLSLNNIGGLDEKLITDLVKFLVDEADSPENDVKFHFKIINPHLHEHQRFKDTDQITIYFDKYSSTGDLVKLTEKIDAFLKKAGVNENTITRGPKDSFGFNSFVSARFDTNKLLSEYDVYPFFDIELQKFFEAYKPEQLKKVPLCALEAVFNRIMLSEKITKLKHDEFKGLTPEDSEWVQNEFHLMMVNPKEYIVKSNNDWDKSHREQKTKLIAETQSLIVQIKKLQFDFSDCQSLEDLDTKIKGEIKRLDDKRLELDKQKKQIDFFDTAVVEGFSLFLQAKEQQLKDAANKQRNILSPFIIKEDLNKNPKIIKLRKALDEMEEYGDRLKSIPGDQLALQKSESATQLAKNLKEQLAQFINNGDYTEKTYKTFDQKFRETVNDQATKDLLSQHRNFTKVIVANVLIALSLVGTLFLVGQLVHSYFTTGKATGFFASPQGAQNLKQIEDQTNDLNLANPG